MASYKSIRRFTLAPSALDLQEVTIRVLNDLPASLRSVISHIPIRIEEFPNQDIEEELNLQSPFDLLGLYSGTALTCKSILDVPTQPDIIFLYRRPILDYWCESGEDLDAVIRHVLIHEIGHHFGFSDEDMDSIENDPSSCESGQNRIYQ